MDLRRFVLAGLLTLVALGAVAGAAVAQSGAVGDCLRNGGDRYQAPGPAVDDQYAGPVDTCQAAGGDVQVTVTPSGSGPGPGSGSGTASGGSGAAPAGGSGGTAAAPSSSATAGTSAGTTPAPSRTRAPRRATTGGAAEAPATTAPSTPSAAEVAVVRAVRQADAAGSVAGPSAVAGAPGWLVALAGVVLAGIIGVAGMQVYRRRR